MSGHNKWSTIKNKKVRKMLKKVRFLPNTLEILQ